MPDSMSCRARHVSYKIPASLPQRKEGYSIATKPGLARVLGLTEVTLGGIGTIVGAGIYVLIGEAAGRAGNAIWLAFAISATLAVFTALSYAELSSMYPHAGAEYAYTEPVAGRRMAFLASWLVMVTGIAASATVPLGFAGYLGALFPVHPIVAVAGLIIILSVVLMYGIRPFRIPGSIRGIPVLPVCGMAASFGLFLQLNLTVILTGVAISVAGVGLSGVWVKTSE